MSSWKNFWCWDGPSQCVFCIQCLVATFSSVSRGQRLTAEHNRPHSCQSDCLLKLLCMCTIWSYWLLPFRRLWKPVLLLQTLHCPAIFDASSFFVCFCAFFFIISWVVPVFNKIKNVLIYIYAYSAFSHVPYIIWFNIRKITEHLNLLEPAFHLFGLVLSGSSPEVTVLYQAGFFPPFSKRKN